MCDAAAAAQCIKGFPQRLKKVIGGQSIRAFALAAGLSEGTLRKYLRNETYPTLDRLVGIVEAGQVCLQWLATGRGPMRAQDRAAAASPGTDDDTKLQGLVETLEATLGQVSASDSATRASDGSRYRIDEAWQSDDSRCYILVIKPES